MSTDSIIPGHPNIKELGFVNPSFFITVKQAQGNTEFHPDHQGSVGRTNGNAELICYVSFNVPDISDFPDADDNTKAFLVPLPNSVSGSKTVQIFDLQPGFILPTALTFNTRPNPDQNLASVTFGGPTGVQPIEMDTFGGINAKFGEKQEFQVRATGDNASVHFSVNPVDTSPNGMALVIGNVS
jgi:hypothetical protein